MLTFLAVVFVVVAVTYFFSKKVLETPEPLIKVTKKEATPVVSETKVEAVVETVKKSKKKVTPKAKKISAKKKAE